MRNTLLYLFVFGLMTFYSCQTSKSGNNSTGPYTGQEEDDYKKNYLAEEALKVADDHAEKRTRLDKKAYRKHKRELKEERRIAKQAEKQKDKKKKKKVTGTFQFY